MSNTKRNNVIIYLSAIVFSLIYTVLLFKQQYVILNGAPGAFDHINHANSAIHLFECIKHGTPGLKEFYSTDLYPHISLYPVWHLVFIIFYQLSSASIETTTALALSIACADGLFIMLTFYLVSKEFLHILQTKKLCINALFACILTGSLLLVGCLDASRYIGSYYLGGYLPNPLHNPTYIAVRPIAFLTLLLYARILSNTQTTSKAYVKAALLLLISAFFKPTFYQVFLPAIFVYCVVYFLKEHNPKVFRRCIYIAFTCIPVSIVALSQIILLPSKEGSGIGYRFLYVWKNYTENWGLSLLVSIAFPLIVFSICAVRRELTKIDALALCVFASATIQYMFFFVKAEPFAGDFSWGLDLALFFLFAQALFHVVLFSWSKPKRNVLNILCIILYIMHFFFGAKYFITTFIIK